MNVVVVCRDAEQSSEARALSLPAHREYVDQWAAILVLSGPLTSDGHPSGQFFVLDVPDRGTAERFVREDPFTMAGVFAEVSIDEIRLVFRDGARI